MFYRNLLILFYPILLFSSISLQWSLRKPFLSPLAILWDSAFKWVYLSFSPLPLASLFFSAICKASSDNHFAFLHFLLYSELFLIRPWLYSISIDQFRPVQSLSHVRLFATPQTAARQASIINSQSLLKLMSIEIGDAFQLSHPLSSPSPPTFNLSLHQGNQSVLCASGSQSIGVSASAAVLPMNIQDWFL